RVAWEWTAGDGIEVGKIERREAEMGAEVLRHGDRKNRRGHTADERPVRAAPARDAAHHDAVHQIEDGNDAHGNRWRNRAGGGGSRMPQFTSARWLACVPPPGESC